MAILLWFAYKVKSITVQLGTLSLYPRFDHVCVACKFSDTTCVGEFDNDTYTIHTLDPSYTQTVVSTEKFASRTYLRQDALVADRQQMHPGSSS